MSCKPYRTSEANAKSYLKTKGAIDAFLNILNINTFRKENIALSEQARKKGVTFEGNIFLEDNNHAVPRKDIFKQVDAKNGVFYQIESEPKVNFDLKVVNKVQSNISKINSWFKQMKDTDQFWKKVQSDLAIPKEQVELLRQSEGDTIEQKLVDFVSKYSQSIEINTAKGFNGDVSNKWFYNEVEPNRFIIYSPDGEPETEFDNIKDTESFIKNKSGENVPNTQHYSNLTVPGGTNYTENEISTPGITPSIKGHAQFSTDNGIGWFRSDVATEDNSIYTESSYQENFTPTKTRRILEVQSDLFQKGRDRNRLVDIINTKIVYTASIFQNEEFNFTLNGDYYESIVKMVYYEEKNQSEPTERYYKNGQRISSKEITIAKEEYIKLKGDLNNENQFLQLLNKNNNWVTFFVKSIIQDSAKKGYEKVLFPLGETIAKIEQYGEAAKIYAKLLAKKQRGEALTVQEENAAKEYEELNQKAVIDFYENTVTNILKKNYKINEVTDEYGNTWNEIELSNKDLENILLQNNSTVSKKNTKLEQDLKEFATINNIRIEFVDSLVEQFGGDYTAAYDAVNKIVYINEGKAGIDTLSEEIAHSLTLALGEDNFLVKKAFNLLSRTDYKSTLDPKYVALYKNNETALKHEVIGKMIAKVLVKQYEPKTESEFKLFGAIMQLIDKFISLFKRNDRLEDTIKELASKITNKEVVAFDEVSKENSVYFQVDTTKVKSKVEDIKEQFVYLKQQLKKNIDKLSSLDKDDPDFPILRDKIKKNKAALEELEATGNKQIVIDLGNELLDNLEIMLNNVEDPDIELKLDNKTINAAETTFSKLAKVPALAQRAMSLEQRLQPIVQEYMVKEINDRATEGREITEEEIFGRTSDVSKLTGWFGKLSNSPNYIARTIHQMIKEVQSKVSAKNKENLHSIKEEVEALRQWSKDNGISEEDMYNVFIQEHKGTTVLTRRFTPEFYKEIDAAFKLPKSERYEALSKIGKYESSLNMWIPKNKKYINENYTKIQNTPALKRFYDFHTSLVTEAASKLPVKINPEFIANISSNSLKDALKSDETTKSKQLLEMASNLTGINIKQFQDGTFVADEGLFQDLIPLKFIASMDASKKSKNLGDNLAKFVNFANNYEEMSEILPTIRSMQNQLGKQSFTKSSDPTIAIKGVETNIYKFIDTVIDMQVKGNMKKDELKIKVGTLTDEEGNPIGEKYVHGSKVADFGMKYNSLLRIGLNPINAVTNLLVGDIGNIIEAFGGRFYTLTNLKDASNIFFKDALNEDSDLNHWRDKIGPLQELEDYETVEQVSTGKGINKEKVENFMYMPQKLGEIWLQNRTMVAILLKDGYMDSDGKTTEKGKNITETELKRLINKCYEVNNKIHGRYSSRDAAAISQQVLPRMMMQFKKWIPAAIESRFESKHFNVDLGVEVEGRYKTGWRLLKRALEGDLKALQAGNMTELELYNMKKNLAEIVIALAATLSFIAMGAFGDDDEELKKNTYYKFTMDQLDRLSGDLLYFYNPGSYTETALKPIALMKTTSDVINCVVAFPHIFGLQGKKDVYQSGSRKGENKFIAKAVDVTPIIAPIAKVARNYKKDVKYQSYK